MRNESQEMREIHDIRLRIYEETKGLTPEERAERTNKVARDIAAEYGLTLVPSKQSSEGRQLVKA